MRKEIFLLLLSCLAGMVVHAQATDDYKNGYVLKGKDTVWCKIRFNSNHDHATKAVRLMIDNEEATLYAGGSITGFGVEDQGQKYHYGVVDVEISVANRRTANLIYVKKIVAGVIDLYEYPYSIVTNKKTTVNGIEKPGTATTSKQNITNYYIAKTDSLFPALSTPAFFPTFRKKDVEPYINDNTDMIATAEKRFSLKELIALINEYNNWYSEKKKQR